MASNAFNLEGKVALVTGANTGLGQGIALALAEAGADIAAAGIVAATETEEKVKALGRRFINLSYREADLFSARSKEFMLSLFPREEIFVSLLPPEARALIGRVGEETEPAKAMLERQGFVVSDHVDPFDGGPYLEADRDAIPLVAATTSRLYGGVASKASGSAFVSVEHKDDFRAVRSAYHADGDVVTLPDETVSALGLPPSPRAGAGLRIGFTPIGTDHDRRSPTAPRRRKVAGGAKP